MKTDTDLLILPPLIDINDLKLDFKDLKFKKDFKVDNENIGGKVEENIFHEENEKKVKIIDDLIFKLENISKVEIKSDGMQPLIDDKNVVNEDIEENYKNKEPSGDVAWVKTTTDDILRRISKSLEFPAKNNESHDINQKNIPNLKNTNGDIDSNYLLNASQMITLDINEDIHKSTNIDAISETVDSQIVNTVDVIHKSDILDEGSSLSTTENLLSNTTTPVIDDVVVYDNIINGNTDVSTDISINKNILPVHKLSNNDEKIVLMNKDTIGNAEIKFDEIIENEITNILEKNVELSETEINSNYDTLVKMDEKENENEINLDHFTNDVKYKDGNKEKEKNEKMLVDQMNQTIGTDAPHIKNPSIDIEDSEYLKLDADILGPDDVSEVPGNTDTDRPAYLDTDESLNPDTDKFVNPDTNKSVYSDTENSEYPDSNKSVYTDTDKNSMNGGLDTLHKVKDNMSIRSEERMIDDKNIDHIDIEDDTTISHKSDNINNVKSNNITIENISGINLNETNVLENIHLNLVDDRIVDNDPILPPILPHNEDPKVASKSSTKETINDIEVIDTPHIIIPTLFNTLPTPADTLPIPPLDTPPITPLTIPTPSPSSPPSSLSSPPTLTPPTTTNPPTPHLPSPQDPPLDATQALPPQTAPVSLPSSVSEIGPQGIVR